jgi:hypothetical protein
MPGPAMELISSRATLMVCAADVSAALTGTPASKRNTANVAGINLTAFAISYPHMFVENH